MPEPDAQHVARATTVVLADDAALFRQAIGVLLESHGLRVVAQVSDAARLRDAVSAMLPDVAIVDIRMSPTDRLAGLRAAVELRARHPEVGILLLSQHLESHYLDVLFPSGACGVGYLHKDRVTGGEAFVDAVRQIATGRNVIDPAVVDLMIAHRDRQGGLPDLARQERAVLALMAEGRSNQAIGNQLNLGRRTVESHISTIFTKLGLAQAPDDHRRVLAVLAHLRAHP
ncbi:response regulator transcription factor [Frankia sp. Ag45/Mut15]|uniref:Response regulator transcription factor n=1 Tax=Frankia umida TaxID=573489 RepID=A0ABT0K0P1_9ACTN|nr:response regulator transcription factor [Frankia umida]MCK9877367.1 response regulator transcription factor [Frankia umida]